MTKDKCVFEYDPEQNRKYFLLAGGRIELQTKGDGSTARIMTQKEQHPVTCFTLDDYMETVANNMQTDIDEYAEQYVEEATASLKQRVAELEGALREIGKGIGYEIDFTEGDAYRIATKALTKGNNNDR